MILFYGVLSVYQTYSQAWTSRAIALFVLSCPYALSAEINWTRSAKQLGLDGLGGANAFLRDQIVPSGFVAMRRALEQGNRLTHLSRILAVPLSTPRKVIG
jgi:hypothetical protein